MGVIHMGFLRPSIKKKKKNVKDLNNGLYQFHVEMITFLIDWIR